MSSTLSNIDALATADDLPAQLAALCGVGRPAHNMWPDRDWARRFAPELSYGRHLGPAPATARRAAVAVLLFRRDGRWNLPLTERPTTLARHAGQISLPGGTLEPGETSDATALRELAEELGVGESIELLGRLSDCYVFASDYEVTPWLAVSHAEPKWRPRSDEVDRVIELPLATLLDEQTAGTTTIERGPVVFRAPCYRFGEHSIWGATSVILGELAELLGRLLDETHGPTVAI